MSVWCTGNYTFKYISRKQCQQNMASDPKQQERFTITSIYAKMDVAAINQKFYSNYWVITTVKVMI